MTPTSSTQTEHPRVLLIISDHWPRALLRAALREAGYDAVGARDLVEALSYPAEAAGRGPVRLLVLDQDLVQGYGDLVLFRLLGRHGDPATLLLGGALHPVPPGPWTAVILRPASVQDIVEAVRLLLPLPAEAAQPLDQ